MHSPFRKILATPLQLYMYIQSYIDKSTKRALRTRTSRLLTIHSSQSVAIQRGGYRRFRITIYTTYTMSWRDRIIPCTGNQLESCDNRVIIKSEVASYFGGSCLFAAGFSACRRCVLTVFCPITYFNPTTAHRRCILAAILHFHAGLCWITVLHGL